MTLPTSMAFRIGISTICGVSRRSTSKAWRCLDSKPTLAAKLQRPMMYRRTCQCLDINTNLIIELQSQDEVRNALLALETSIS